MISANDLNAIGHQKKKKVSDGKTVERVPYSFQFVPVLFVVSTSAMLILDQRTMQIKYRVPATDIYRLSLSPFFDDIAVVHVKVVRHFINSLAKRFLSLSLSLSSFSNSLLIPET
jgi:hypothetical protein